MACDEDRCGNIFQDEAEVVWERRPGEELRPPRPPEPPWWSHMSPAPDRARDVRLRWRVEG